MFEELKLTKSMEIIRKNPFFIGIAMISPFLFYFLIQSFSMIVGQEAMIINKETTTWLESLYLPGSGIPFSDVIGQSFTTINETLLINMLGLKAIFYFILYGVLVIVLAAGFLGSWRKVLEEEKPTLLTFWEDAKRFSPELLIQWIIIMILGIPVSMILTVGFSELGVKIMMVIVTFLITTASYHIVFHNMSAWEGIKYGIKYVLIHRTMIVGLYAFSIAISTILFFTEFFLGSFTPIFTWFLMSFVGPVIIGALSIYVWQNPPLDY